MLAVSTGWQTSYNWENWEAGKTMERQKFKDKRSSLANRRTK
jgi:hypothetical protein